MSGGDNTLILRGTVSKTVNHIKKYGDKTISTIIKTIVEVLGSLLLKFPAFKNLYNVIKSVKIVFVSGLGILAARTIARCDYWALIICDASPNTDLSDADFISHVGKWSD